MSDENLKVGMVSLGCPKNLVDSEVMLGELSQRGHTLVSAAEDADVLVVNTCAFIESSKEESVNTILEMADLKARGNLQKLIVTGCLAQRYKKHLEAEMPEVDHFIGTGEFQNIGDFLPGKGAKTLPMTRSRVAKPTYLYDENTPRLSTLPSHVSYIKIAEGCSRRCSFCIIPRLRGDGRSRTIASVVEEVTRLVAQGTREIHLLAQDLTAYGHDLEDGTSLKDLLIALEDVDGLEWIRLMYVYPEHIDDALIDVIAESQKVCPYLDMPLQHIDEDLLAAMNRDVDEGATLALLNRLKDRIPGVVLRTTLIAGFPGETEAQFQKLLKFVQEFEFDRLGVFAYSQEEGTVAGQMSNQIAEDVKAARVDAIMRAQQEISARKLQAMMGNVIHVLVDRHEPKATEFHHIGRSEGQALDIDGNVFLRGEGIEPGKFYRAKVVDASEYDLFAEVI